MPYDSLRARLRQFGCYHGNVSSNSVAAYTRRLRAQKTERNAHIVNDIPDSNNERPCRFFVTKKQTHRNPFCAHFTNLSHIHFAKIAIMLICIIAELYACQSYDRFSYIPHTKQFCFCISKSQFLQAMLIVATKARRRRPFSKVQKSKC